MTNRLMLIIIAGCIVLSSALFSCSDNNEASERQQEHFVRTYVELLIIREQFPDTIDANPRVRALLLQEGYTQESFKMQFNQLAQNAEKFRATIDSARSRARAIVRGMEPDRKAEDSTSSGPAPSDSAATKGAGTNE